MPRMTEKDLENEIIAAWNAYNKSEQPDHESGYKMIIKNRPDALDVLLGEADYSTQVIEQ